MPYNLTPGGTPRYITGKFGQALAGGGASNNSGGGAATLPLAFPFTVEGFFCCGSPSGTGGIFNIPSDSSAFNMFAASGALTISGKGAIAGGTFPNGTSFFHFAIVFTSSGYRVYFNGNYLATYSGAVNLADPTVSFGGYLPDNSAIDECYVRSGEIYTGTATYTVPGTAFTGNEAGRIALYHLDGDLTDAGANATLTIGSLKAKSTRGNVTLTLSSALVGGSGTGYKYALYRGTTPDFTPDGTTLISNDLTFTSVGGVLTYLDTAAVAGTQYYYGLVGRDSDGTTVNAVPDMMAAITRNAAKLLYEPGRRWSENIAFVYMGNSIINGDTVTGTRVWETVRDRLKYLGGDRGVVATNTGTGTPDTQSIAFNGAAIQNFDPTDTTFGGSTNYARAKNAMTALLAADATATPVLLMFFGANESSNYGSSLTATQYVTYFKRAIDQWLVDFPTCKVVIHRPIWYSPNTSLANVNGAGRYEQAGLALMATYNPAIDAMIAAYATSKPGQVLAGDTAGYNHFAENYQAEMTAQAGENGNHFLHPNNAGAISLGQLHADATYSALFAPRRFTLLAA